MKRVLKHMMTVGLLGSFALAGCSGNPVLSQSESSVDLSTYKSYRWIGPGDAERLHFSSPPVQHLTGTSRIMRNPDLENQIRREVDSKLGTRGYVPSSTAEPDMFVTFFSSAGTEQWISTWSGATPSTNGVPVVIFPRLDNKYAEPVKENTIYLTFFDARSGDAIWSGSVKSMDIASAADHLVKEFGDEAKS